jgi:CheY-like chemotaxis protein
MGQNSGKLILMIEDSDEDYVALQRVFKKSNYDFQLERTANAHQTLDFLMTRGEYKDRLDSGITPSLILLDLNLPGLDGRELLLQLKRDSRFKEIPVVILTTSNNPRDVLYCYRNGANGYQIKTVGFDKFFNSIRSMISYWFETATIPSTLN